MKKERTLLLVLLFAACHIGAQQQTNAWSAPYIRSAFASRTNAPADVTFTVPAPRIHLFGPARPAQPPRPLRIQGQDTRAWTTIAETRAGKQAFPNGENHKAGLCLMWWGSEPQTP